MKRASIAAVTGVLLGLVVFFAVVERSSEPAAVTEPSGSGTADPSAEPSLSTVFSDAQHPGLRVSVSRDGHAEPGVQVLVFRAERDAARGVMRWATAGEEHTDDAGQCALPALTGSHLVIATATDGRKAVRQFEIASATEETLLALSLDASRRITGRVIDADTKDPIANATVRVEPTEATSLGVAVRTTDSLGRFTIDVPPFEKGHIEARAPRHVHASVPITMTTTEIELPLAAGALIDGRTLAQGGAPLAEVTVHIAPSELEAVTSDAEGRFQVLVPRGSVAFHAIANDGRQALERLLTRGLDHATIALTLRSGTSLVGVVHGGGPGTEVSVVVEPHGPTVATIGPGADGRFEARGLPEGRYSVIASRGGGARATAIGVDVPQTAPLELTLTDAARVKGTVIAEGDVAVAGATVTAQWDPRLNELTRTARTNEAGQFDFDDLPPGEVTLDAAMGEQASFERATYLAAGSVVEVTLSLAPRGQLTGVVFAENPMQDVSIRGPMLSEHVRSSSDGLFGMALPAGTYRVAVMFPGHEAVVREVEVRAGAESFVELRAEGHDAGFHRQASHRQLGSGLSFENAAGGVRIDFLSSDCPASRAGLQMGDVVVSIDGENTRDASDAFSRVHKPVGEELRFVVRREGQDVPLTVK